MALFRVIVRLLFIIDAVDWLVVVTFVTESDEEIIADVILSLFLISTWT